MLVLLACSNLDSSTPADDSFGGFGDSGDYEADADTDADTDTDTDADSDADTDSDTDADWDTGDTTEPDEGDTAVDTDTSACDDVTPVQLYLSPDDSNSMSSPVQVRDAVLDRWTNLQDVPVRTWEFFNYYSFAYPAPEADLAVTSSLSRTGDDTYVLQIGVASPALATADRAPINLVFALDTSGSMSGDPFNRMIDVLDATSASLLEGDVVSIVQWSSSNTVLLEAYTVSGPDDPVLTSAIRELAIGGGTNLSSGLVAAYQIADTTWDPTRINRVVLISDGGANLGETDGTLIGEYAAASDRDGVYMVGVGVGTATTYNDTLIDEVTDLGRGASVFVSTEAEAWDRFTGANFLEIMDVAARNVSVDVTLPPGFEIERFSGEEYSTDPREIEPQHLAPGDTMVFYQTLRTCAPERVEDTTALTVSVRWQDAHTFEHKTASATNTFAELLAADTQLLDKGAAVYAYAESLKACQRASEREWPALLEPARTRVDAARVTDPDDADLREIDAVLDALGG